MKNISDISKKLKRGDKRDIAAATGFSERYVGYVLNPKDDRANDLVIRAARLIIANREKFGSKLSR